MPVKVFLSHASEDKPLIRDFYAQLTTLGFQPWLDEVELIPGMNWKDEIKTQIRECSIVLACLTPQSAKTGFLREEFEYSIEQYACKRRGRIYLIPVKLLPCDIPEVYHTVSGISLQDFHWLDYYSEGGLDRLMESMRAAGIAFFHDWLQENQFTLACHGVWPGPLILGKRGKRDWIPALRTVDGVGGPLIKANRIADIINSIEGKTLAWKDNVPDLYVWDLFVVPNNLLLGDAKLYSALTVYDRPRPSGTV